MEHEESKFNKSSLFYRDVSVLKEEAKNRFANNFVPNPDTKINNQLVLEALSFFSRPLKIISLSENDYTQTENRSRNKFVFQIDIPKAEENTTSKHALSRENSISSTSTTSKQSNKEALSAFELLEKFKVFSPMTQQNLSLQSKASGNQQDGGLLWRYYPHYDQKLLSPSISVKRPSLKYQSYEPNQVIIQCQKLSFSINDMEPFYCRLALYNLKEEARISEYFSFDLNNSEVLFGDLLKNSKNSDAISKCKNAIFSISDQSPDVFLVIHIDKILQGDPDSTIQPYLTDRIRSIDTVKRKVKQTIARLKNYKQEFAWGMIQLFNQYGRVLDSNDGQMKIANIYAKKPSISENEFITMINDLRNDQSLQKKHKLITNAHFIFSIRKLDFEPSVNRVDPSLIPLKIPSRTHNIEIFKTGINTICREIEEFKLQDQLIPNIHYVNSMYICPESIQFSKHRNISCKVQLKMDDGSVHSEGLKTVFGSNSAEAFVDHMFTPVNWHIKSPKFMSEIKIMLPFAFTEKSHLFFTFYQVSCQPPARGKNIEEVIGYACLKIYQHGNLIQDGIHELLIVNKLSDEYLKSYFKEGNKTKSGTLKLTNEAIFTVKTKTLSNIFCQDNNLNNFFRHFSMENMSSSEGSRTLSGSNINNYTVGDSQHQAQLIEAISSLENADIKNLIKFFPSILSYQIKLIASNIEIYQTAAFHSIISLVHCISKKNKTIERFYMFEIWIRYLFDNYNQVSIYSIFCREQEKALMKINKEELTNYIQYSQFIFEVMFKSMCLEIVNENSEKNNSHCRSRNGKTGVLKEIDQFSKSMINITSLFVQHLSFYDDGFGLTILKEANNSFAVFLTKIAMIVDKNLIIKIVKTYDESLTNDKDLTLFELKINFFSIFFDFYKYVEFCNPISQNLIQDYGDIMNVLAKSYPLPFLLVNFVKIGLNFNNEKNTNNNYKLSELLLNIFTKHDYDNRYQDSKVKQAIASMYLPFIKIISEINIKIHAIKTKFFRNLMACFLWILRHCDRNLLKRQQNNEKENVVINFLRLLDYCLAIFNYIGSKKRGDLKEVDSYLSPESTKAFAMDPSFSNYFDCKSNIESMYTTAGSVKLGQPSLKTKKTGGSTLRERRIKMQKGGSLRRPLNMSLNKNNSMVQGDSKLYISKLLTLEGQLTETVGQTIISVMIDFIDVKNSKSQIDDYIGHNVLLTFVSVFIKALSSNLPDNTYILLYNLLQYFIENTRVIFSSKIFEDNLISIINQIICHCTFSNIELRSMSSKILYYFAKCNYQVCGNFDLFHKATTTSFSTTEQLSDLTQLEVLYLEQCLNSIKLFAEKDIDLDKIKLGKSGFKKAVIDVSNKILGIFLDALEIIRQGKLEKLMDLALYEDLLYNFASAYLHIPKVHIDWMNRLACHLEKNGSFAEAAHCFIQMADIAEAPDLTGKNKPKKLLSGVKGYENGTTFTKLSLKEEHCRINKHYKGEHEDNVMNQLQKACHLFSKARLYEDCNIVYARLLPMLNNNKEYSRLSDAHKNLHSVFQNLVNLKNEDNRFLGTYYRVGFYGNIFSQMNGKQYVYKMPNMTQLSEIMNDLLSKYKSQFNVDIKVYPNSEKIKQANLDEFPAIIQITHLNPYFGAIDNKNMSFVEKNFSLNKFKYSTPFTETGKAHGDITIQQKRITYVDVAETFPTFKTRQEIINSQEIILSPIESAVDDIQSRSEFFDNNIKLSVTLNEVTAWLSGSIMPQVNGGMLEICKAFLDKNVVKKYNSNEISKLKSCLIRFSATCKTAVTIHKLIIDDKLKNKEIQNESNEHKLLAEFEKRYKQMEKDIEIYTKTSKVSFA